MDTAALRVGSRPADQAEKITNVSVSPRLVEQVVFAVDTWSVRLGRLISPAALALLSGLPSGDVELGLDELVRQRLMRLVGPGIFVQSQVLN
jgi:hypothetical protein